LQAAGAVDVGEREFVALSGRTEYARLKRGRMDLSNHSPVFSARMEGAKGGRFRVLDAAVQYFLSSRGGAVGDDARCERGGAPFGAA